MRKPLECSVAQIGPKKIRVDVCGKRFTRFSDSFSPATGFQEKGSLKRSNFLVRTNLILPGPNSIDQHSERTDNISKGV